jgi:hypothetical protein
MAGDILSELNRLDEADDEGEDDGALSEEEIKVMLKLRKEQIKYEEMYPEEKDVSSGVNH